MNLLPSVIHTSPVTQVWQTRGAGMQYYYQYGETGTWLLINHNDPSPNIIYTNTNTNTITVPYIGPNDLWTIEFTANNSEVYGTPSPSRCPACSEDKVLPEEDYLCEECAKVFA